MLVRLIGLVASLGDSHTSVGYQTQRGLPLMMYWFKDGIHILNTTGKYKSILHGRITAVFAGEPTGGKPKHFGEVQSFELPNSKLQVGYSVKYFQVIEGDPESFVPELLVEPTSADFLMKKDPVLETILKK